MNREEKIEAIYKEIADKTLSFGCRIKSKETNRASGMITHSNKALTYITKDGSKLGVEKTYSLKERIEIIGHPVMIGDVLDYLEDKYNYGNSNLEEWLNTETSVINLWEYKRKSIEKQPNECINFIYNLIQEGKK